MAVRVAVDAMGGDHAPRVTVQGATQALADFADLEVILVGDQARIEKELTACDPGVIRKRVSIVHASQVVGMDEAPVEALKAKRDSSLHRMVELAISGEADAVLSAGNTGATAAICQLKLRPLRCVTRPGIAVTIPTFHGPFVLCDVGANIQAKARHLYEYAVMATLYAERVIGIKNPRVGLMSIGEESRKGTDLVKQTHELLAGDSEINFTGNVEGADLFQNRCDVAICDGFVGNIALKFMESLAEGLFETIAQELESEDGETRDSVKAALDRVWARHDSSEYGGAPLLGVDGVCIICHGRSDERAIRNALRTGEMFQRTGFNDAIRARLAG